MTPRSAFFGGVRAELPILVGVVPFGLIYGVAAISAGLGAPLSQAMSAVVFAGSAQFITAQLIGTGLPAFALIATAFIVNLRHALYSASVAPYLTSVRPIWRWVLAYLLTDEAYAVVIINYREDSPITYKHWFFLGAGLALWSAWQLSTAAGVFLGAHIPASWSFDFALPLTFIALVVPAIHDRAGIAVASIAGICAVAATNLPYKSGLLLATTIGIATALILVPKPADTLLSEGDTI